MLIDSVTDQALAPLVKASMVLELPAFVKEAHLPTEDDVKDLPPNSFADTTGRKFPMHTKAACWTSYVYFLNQADRIEKYAQARIRRQFDKMARYWGIEKEMEAAFDALCGEPVEKKASASDFALSMTFDGKKYNYFPINNRQAILKSASDLVEHRAKFVYSMRKEAARNLIQAAVDTGVPEEMLPDQLASIAGYGTTTKEAACHEIRRRINAAHTAEEKQAAQVLVKLAGMLDTYPEILPVTSMEKIAESLDVYDRFTKLNQHYGREIQFPEDALCAFTKRAASKVANEVIRFVNGRTYWLHDLEKGAAAFAILGDLKSEMCDLSGSLDLHKVAEIAPTLPRDDAENLHRALSAAGIPEAAINKAAFVNRVTGFTPPAAQEDRFAALRERVKAASAGSKREAARLVKVAKAEEVMKKLKKEVTDELDLDDEADGPKKPKDDTFRPRDTDGKFLPKAKNKEETKPVNVLEKDD